MEDWALIRRLVADGVPQRQVERAVAWQRPPKYERPAVQTSFAAFETQVGALLMEHPDLPATVLAERVGWMGSITWFRYNVRRMRPEHRPVDPADRVQWLPCDVVQCDLRFPPRRIGLEDGSRALLPVLVMTAAYSRFTLTRMIPTRRTEDLLLATWLLLQLREALAGEGQAVRRDLPDLVDIMIAIGFRIGEAIAITWDAVGLTAGTLEVRGTVIRVAGEGMVLEPSPKSAAGVRILVLPSWAVAMPESRRPTVAITTGALVFPNPQGDGIRDPSNTSADLGQAFTAAGFHQVTFHTFRKTVATLMDHAGLSPRAAADQLGHAKVSMTTDVYMGRRTAHTGAADVLESLVRQGISTSTTYRARLERRGVGASAQPVLGHSRGSGVGSGRCTSGRGGLWGSGVLRGGATRFSR
ncbi:MAG: site-specific integrase [Pseudonocardia sp.]|nr:site-specific integrase [Pseudonocardia sp.]